VRFTRNTHQRKTELVVQDAVAYQKIRQVAEEARVLDGIRRGIEDTNAGRTVSPAQFKAHARANHGIKAQAIP
jgi:predicted transcriptional regulator